MTDTNKHALTICPFCKEEDFDLVGLKHHLTHSCQIYEETLTLNEERALMELKQRTGDKNND